jgi:uncharacterized damage-inducible protein DinB
MKEALLMYAHYTKRADASVVSLLEGLNAERREEDRKSYYGSLSGLARHVLGGTLYFHSMFRPVFPEATAALKATEGLSVPKGRLTDTQWAEIAATFPRADEATVEFIQALGEDSLSRLVPIDWYEGKPGAVPFCFLAHQLWVHGTHHRGQISQILDEMGIEHDFSGIDIEFLPV